MRQVLIVSAPAGAHLAIPVGGGTEVVLSGSLLALPLGGGTACELAPGTATSSGGNFLADGSCGAGGTDTVSAADPLLGRLANNGG